MVKDLMGTIWKVNDTTCPAGYGIFSLPLWYKKDGKLLEIERLPNTNVLGAALYIGYGIKTTTDSDGNTIKTLIAQNDSILIMNVENKGENDIINPPDNASLSNGDELIIGPLDVGLYATSITDSLSQMLHNLEDVNLINWLEQHCTVITPQNMNYSLKCNGKYIDKVNDKVVRNIVYNDKEKNIKPLLKLPSDETTITLTSSNETSNSQFPLIIGNMSDEPIEIYKNDELLQTIEKYGVIQPEIIVEPLETAVFKIKKGKIIFLSCGNTGPTIDSFILGNNLYKCFSNRYIFGIVSSQYKLPSFVAVSTCFSKNILKNINILCFLSVDTQDNTDVIIPRNCVVLLSGMNLATSIMTSVITNSITFEHLETDTLYIGEYAFKPLKNATPITVYHYGNPTVLNYDWAASNYTVTFVDLREQQ